MDRRYLGDDSINQQGSYFRAIIMAYMLLR